MSESLVIKPILRCNANCNHCDSRLNLHKSKKNEIVLNIGQWSKVFEEAKSMGVTSLHISGGEPFLYKHIFELIRIGKRLNFKININTNGSLLNNHERIEKLSILGVDSITISFLSHDPLIHNSIKKLKKLHQNGTQAINLAKEAGISTYAQTILLNGTILNFDKILNWVIQVLKVDALFISYVEGPFGTDHPSLKQIEKFRSDILPKATKLVQNSFEKFTANRISATLNSLFDPSVFDFKNISQGIYNNSSFHCDVPEKQILILANGDVHPCNAIEYFHKPIAGNIHQSSLIDIYKNDIYEKVKKEGTYWCSICPVKLHACIQFTNNEILRGPTGLRIKTIRDEKD